MTIIIGIIIGLGITLFFYCMGVWEEKQYYVVLVPKKHYRVSKVKQFINKITED